MSLRMRLTYPRPLSPMHDWLAVFVTRSGPFQGHKGQPWKLSLEKTKKARMMKEGQEASDWWSPSKQTEKRNRVLGGGGEKETNVERDVCCTDRKDGGVDRNIWCMRSACRFCPPCNWLVALMPPSCVYWFKLCADTRMCIHAGKQTHTDILSSSSPWIWHVFLLKLAAAR